MVDAAAVREQSRDGADAPARVVIQSAALRCEILRLDAGSGIEWQRCPVADRVFVVTEGSGFCYRSHGRDDLRDEIGVGDVVSLKRMIWHRIVASPDHPLVGALVTSPALEVEYRR